MTKKIILGLQANVFKGLYGKLMVNVEDNRTVVENYIFYHLQIITSNIADFLFVPFTSHRIF